MIYVLVNIHLVYTLKMSACLICKCSLTNFIFKEKYKNHYYILFIFITYYIIRSVFAHEYSEYICFQYISWVDELLVHQATNKSIFRMRQHEANTHFWARDFKDNDLIK